jgi:hypothetical protein
LAIIIAGMMVCLLSLPVGLYVVKKSLFETIIGDSDVWKKYQAESEVARNETVNVKAIPTQADIAASEKSASDCIASFKAGLLPSGQFAGGDTFCTMATPSNWKIRISGRVEPSKRDNDLMLSDISNFIRIFANHDYASEKEETERILLTPLPTDRVYKVGMAYQDSSGNISDTREIVAGLRSYTVLGAQKMYWVRCNATSDDSCVIYSDVYGRPSFDGNIDGDSDQPDGRPWPGDKAACFIWVKFSFQDSPQGTQLPAIVNMFEAWLGKISADESMQNIFEKHCNYRGPKW